MLIRRVIYCLTFMAGLARVSWGQTPLQEQLVVEDLPEYLQRISDYLSQADVPPRQVLIEAHVLQVTLKESNVFSAYSCFENANDSEGVKCS